MLNLDPAKLLVIAVVAIILLGPDRLPQLARQIGGAWRSFNEFRRRMETEVRSTMPDLPPTSEIARLARSPSALLAHLSNLSEDGDEEAAGAEGVEGTDGGPAAGAAADTEPGETTNGLEPAGAADSVTGNGSHRATDGSPHAAEDPASATPVVPPTPIAPAAPVAPSPETVVSGDPTLN
jgi:sec-independent protein translocase protein TatB